MISLSTKRLSLLLAWLIALTALIITLYSSEIKNLPVCHLCWYQRIGMYPLTVLLAIALFRDDLSIYIYAIPLALITAVFAFYQYLLQMFPKFAPISFCTAGPSCSDIHLQLFGFITFPFLSFIAAFAIIILLVISKHRN